MSVSPVFGHHGDRLLYTPDEAAEVLAIGRWKLFDLLAEGKIESIKIGHSRRILRASLEAFIAAQLSGGGDAAA